MEHLAEMLEMKEESNVIGVRLAFIVEEVMEQVTTHVQWVIIVQEIQLRLHSTHALLDIILKRWAQKVSQIARFVQLVIIVLLGHTLPRHAPQGHTIQC